jgi:cell division septation protein DedD
MKTAKDKNIWHYVIHLMHTHDCVVVPNFGGFLLHAEYANVDAISELMNPSNRKVSFNQKLNLNDGLLATYIADELKISYADSIKLIEIELKAFLLSLNSEKRIEIALLGTFILNDSNNFQFIPNGRTNFLMSAFGLQPLQLCANKGSSNSNALPLNKMESKFERKLNATNKTQKGPRTGIKKGSNIWYTLLATFMIVVLLFNAYILLETYPVEPLSNAISKMNLSANFEEFFATKSIDTKDIKVESLQKEVKLKEHKATSQIKVDSLVAVQASEVDIESALHPNTKINTSYNINIGDSVYYIIVGAFRHSRRATALSTKLKNNGYEASEVVEPKKFHFKMVTIGSFTNMSEVSKSLIQVQEEMPDAWVCMSVK